MASMPPHHNLIIHYIRMIDAGYVRRYLTSQQHLTKLIVPLQTLLSYNTIVTISLFIIITVMASLAALLLPIETRGRAMKVNSVIQAV